MSDTGIMVSEEGARMLRSQGIALKRVAEAVVMSAEGLSAMADGVIACADEMISQAEVLREIDQAGHPSKGLKLLEAFDEATMGQPDGD